MSKITKTQTTEQAKFVYILAQDAADAYSLAHEVVSELSAIFETIEKMAISGISDEHVTNKLSSVGFSHALHRLDLIERNMKNANRILAELDLASQ